jgi:hypothetical protein
MSQDTMDKLKELAAKIPDKYLDELANAIVNGCDNWECRQGDSGVCCLMLLEDDEILDNIFELVKLVKQLR